MKKILSAVLAAVFALTALSGCGKTETANSGADTNNSTDTSKWVYPTWDNIDRNKVIASVEGQDSAKFDITFGDFYSEYLYYLLSYSIDDDMSTTYKDQCETFREEIITYLTFEHIFLEVAEEMGCGISSLTDEDKATIKANVQTTTDNFISSYTAMAEEELGEGATEDQILNRSTEMLVADLARAELTTDIFEKWETNNYIQEKLLTLLAKNIEVTDADVEGMFNEYVDMAKKALETDKVSYEMDSTLTWIYVPEGTRLADQILVMFDEATRTAISEARSAGNDAEADKLREEAYNAEMQEKVNNIYALIESGSDFDKLQETYNEDTANDPYSVIPDSALYVPEFTEAVFSVENVGGVAEPAISDYGVHIIKYAGDDSVTAEEKEEIFASMTDYIFEQKEMEIQEQAYEIWMERFPYTIDYTLLKITPDADADDALISE